MKDVDLKKQTIIEMLGEMCSNLTEHYNKHLGKRVKCTGTHIEFLEDMSIAGEFKLVISFRIQGE